MGLDITFYPAMKPIDPDDYTAAQFEDMFDDGDVIELFAYRQFPHALDGHNYRDMREYENAFITAGFVRPLGATTHASISYRGHCAFRDDLARRFLNTPSAEVIHDNPGRYKDKPFYDLINFAYNEGCLATAACARLAEAFNANHYPVDADYHYYWNQLKAGFNHAANGGLACFY